MFIELIGFLGFVGLIGFMGIIEATRTLLVWGS